MGRFHWHDVRDFERGTTGRDSERHGERWDSDWNEERRQRRRPRGPDEHWCCPDWEHEKEGDVVPAGGRYSGGRWSNRKREGYYGRDSHESPWEGDQEEPQSPRYLTAKRNWKRPSSASEMDRKSGEIKPRQGPFYVNAGGSDGERDRRYKAGRRSKSRDSQQFGEARDHQRHKPDPGLTLRYPHRSKPYAQKSGFENDFELQDVPKSKGDAKQDAPAKKPAAAGRKRSKDPTKAEAEGSLPRRCPTRMQQQQQSMFESDFVPSETESPVPARNGSRFSFENELETSEAESPTVGAHLKAGGKPQTTKFDDLPPVKRKQTMFEADFREARRQKTILKANSLVDKEGNRSAQHRGNVKQRSLFEDDFSPTDKASEGQFEEDYGISSITEEPGGEGNDSFSVSNSDRATNLSRKQKHLISKNRNSLRGEVNIKKSESVNIFARENDPFDDDFFSSHDDVADTQSIEISKVSPRNPEFKWTEDFESFDNGRRK